MPNPAINQLMESMLKEKPHLAPLMQMLQAQPDQPKRSSKLKQKGAINRLKEQIHDLNIELQIADAIIEEVAQSLGACPTCCGQMTDCEDCHGKGVPGTYAPNQESVERYLLPLLKQHPWILQLVEKE